MVTVSSRAFEGLFGHQYRAEQDPALAAELLAVGYDLAYPRESYPLAVWRAALEVARRHRYPTLGEAEGAQRVGRDFVSGVALTLVGRVLAVAAPLLGPERVMARIPTYLRIARDDSGIQLQLIDRNTYLLDVMDPVPAPFFVAGAVEGCLLLAGVRPTCTVVERWPDRYRLRASW